MDLWCWPVVLWSIPTALFVIVIGKGYLEAIPMGQIEKALVNADAIIAQ